MSSPRSDLPPMVPCIQAPPLNNSLKLHPRRVRRACTSLRSPQEASPRKGSRRRQEARRGKAEASPDRPLHPPGRSLWYSHRARQMEALCSYPVGPLVPVWLHPEWQAASLGERRRRSAKSNASRANATSVGTIFMVLLTESGKGVPLRLFSLDRSLA
jgi:hypothetical protein